MHFPRKRWRLAGMAVLAALAVSVTFAAPAFAAVPGESGTWYEEEVGNQPLEARGHVTEARNNGELLQVWRGENNNNVWLSYDNGQPFTLGSTTTYVSPTVVPMGSNNFMVLHTGTDGSIYYAMVYPNGTANPGWTGYWTAIPYQSTHNTVSVTQFGPGSNDLYMVYRSSTDDRIWGTRYNAADVGWDNVENIMGGESPAAPSVAWNNQSGTLNVVSRGEDNQVWMINGYSYDWNSWSPQGGYTYVQPTIAVNPNDGNMLVAYVNENSYIPNYRAYAGNGYPLGDWSQDITYWQTVNAVGLSFVSGAIYAIISGLNQISYFKQVWYDG